MGIADWFTRPRITLRLNLKKEDDMGRMTPWGPIPDLVTTAPTFTFAAWVDKYRDKRNPSGAYYSLDEMVAESKADKALVYSYVKYAQDENYDWVLLGNRPLTDTELIARWIEDHPAQPAKPSKPFQDMTIYELQQLYNRL